MSNETMPEKTYTSQYPGMAKTARQLAEEFPDLIVGELGRDVSELQRQNAALKAFVEKAVDLSAVSSGVTSDDLMTIASMTGLLDEDGGFDDWMTDDTAKIPIPSRTEVAREFVKAVFELADINGYFGPLCMKEVLKEWENAGTK